LARPEREGLVLQGALAAAVADRAVEGVVEQEELQVRDLGGLPLRTGVLRHDDHARRDGRGARREQLALPFDLDVALTAGADRILQRVITEPRDLDPQLLGRADDQRAGGHGQHLAVDRERHHPRAHDAATSTVAGSVVSELSGHRPSSTCASYSSMKYCSVDEIGDTAP